MPQRIIAIVILALAVLSAAGCVPSSSASSAEIIDPRPVALRLEELPVGFITREALYASGREYRERFQLADLRTQEDSGGLSNIWIEVTSQPSLQDAKDVLTVFRDEDAADLLIQDFVRSTNPTAADITTESIDFPLNGVDDVIAYRTKWHDDRGYWAVYSIRFQVTNMTAWVQAITETTPDGTVEPVAKTTARALMEVQARKMTDAQK